MVNPNEDTEFNDILRAKGILPPKPPSRSPSPDIPHITHRDAIGAIAATADHVQLSTLLDNEQLDSEDEAIFESYKQKRLQEMRKEEKRGRFGSMEPLAREDFVREVTEGSKEVLPGDEPEEDDIDEDEDEGAGGATRSSRSRKLKGTGVVVFLFKDSIPLSQRLRPLLASLARYHPSTKFLSIPAGLCIPNYPDKNVPTLLIYRNGDMVGNVVAGMGLRGMQTTIQDLEGLLLRYTALEKPSAELRAASRRQDDDDDESGDDMGDGVGTVNAKAGGVRTGGQGLGTGRGARRDADSDDSDFDM